MKKKVSQFAYGLVNYRYAIRMRSISVRILAILRSFKTKGPQALADLPALVGGFLYLAYWLFLIIVESPMRFWRFLDERSFYGPWIWSHISPWVMPWWNRISPWLHKSYYHIERVKSSR